MTQGENKAELFNCCFERLGVRVLPESCENFPDFELGGKLEFSSDCCEGKGWQILSWLLWIGRFFLPDCELKGGRGGVEFSSDCCETTWLLWVERGSLWGEGGGSGWGFSGGGWGSPLIVVCVCGGGGGGRRGEIPTWLLWGEGEIPTWLLQVGRGFWPDCWDRGVAEKCWLMETTLWMESMFTMAALSSSSSSSRITVLCEASTSSTSKIQTAMK